MFVRDYMNREVFTLRREQKLFAVRRIMEWAHLRHIPVVNADHEVEGMVTHRDLLRLTVTPEGTRLSRSDRERLHCSIAVRDVMRSPVVTIEPDVPVQEAARLMRIGKLGALPVTEHRKLVGIVTEHDLLAVVERLPLEDVQLREIYHGKGLPLA